MSFRPAPRHDAAPVRAVPSPDARTSACAKLARLAELQAPPTGCSFNSFIGTNMPCGAVIHYHPNDAMKTTYVCTRKTMASLDLDGTLLTDKVAMDTKMQAVHAAMATMGGLSYPFVYAFREPSAFDVDAAMTRMNVDAWAYGSKTMGSTEWTYDGPAFRSMLQPVRAALETAYGADYEFLPFRSR